MGLTHSTLPPGDVDAEMNTYEIHRILFFSVTVHSFVT